MYTYDVVSESFRNPQELAAELTRRSHEGWEVVEIVSDGTNWLHAFIRHAGNVAVAPRPGMTASTVTTATTPTTAAAASTATTTPQPAVAPTATAQNGPAPSVPANWYKDPSGRFELRYWNGSAWTEHVSTGGTQSIDPPKA